MSDPEDILKLADELDQAATKVDRKTLDKLDDAAARAAKSFSGSWLGYHSRVYYANLEPVPPGARFSAEWGFGDRLSNDTVGDWRECDFDSVIAQIEAWAGNPDKDQLQADADKALSIFEEGQAKLLSVLSRYHATNPDDKFLAALGKKIEEETNWSISQVVSVLRGRGKVFTRDSTAGHAGFQTPPHIQVAAEVMVWGHPFTLCANLAKHARRIGSHLASLDKETKRASRIGTHVFIGHGRSQAWKDFREFIQDRLSLPTDEFNRVPVAGVTTISRLTQMLDDAAIAFIIMTAEDEQPDGKVHARMNVIHEAGLFQGRLGFERSIILLEEGCEEFSNVHGLGQIRFSRGRISDAFEEVRRVLEREELIDAPAPNISSH